MPLYNGSLCWRESALLVVISYNLCRDKLAKFLEISGIFQEMKFPETTASCIVRGLEIGLFCAFNIADIFC